MRRKIMLVFVFAGIFFKSHAQSNSIKGFLKDEADNSSIAGATVSLLLQSDSTPLKTTVSDSAGFFQFTDLAADSFIIKVNILSYQQYVSFVTLTEGEGEHDMGSFALFRRGKDLANVTVIAEAPPVSQKADTTQYSANQYKVNPDATTEDLIKKMPGITVDKAGTVTAQGEQVKKVTVDGKDFFGDDATAALRNLPAEIIDKIQVFDRLSDQAQFTGFDDGNTVKAINIVTKTGSRNGQFGRVYAGYGTDERYTAGGNVSFFNGDRRVSLVGLFNNVNQQNFGSEDLLGVTSSSGGGRQGGGRGGGGNRGGSGGGGNFNNSNNFLVGQQNGISSTNAFGINYSDKWSSKLNVTGSYFFNNSKTGNNQLTNDQYFIQNDSTQFYTENSLSSSENFNHRFNMRMEYKIDSFNTILFTPSLSLQKNSSDGNVNGVRYFTLNELISSAAYTSDSRTSGFNTNNNLLYRHAFAKKGRTVSLNLNVSANHKDGDVFLESSSIHYDTATLAGNDSLQQYTSQLVNGTTYSGSVAYTEPVGKKAQLQFSYSPSLQKNSSDQQVYQFNTLNNKYSLFDSSLSNRFDNTVTSHTGNISFRAGDRENMFVAGLSYKSTALNSDRLFPYVATVDKSFTNLLPNLIWRKKFSAKSSINLNYRMSTNVPSVNQLQDVINKNDPLFLTSGNPDLKQQVTNTLSARYTFTNTGKGKSFFANIYLQQADSYIGNAVYIADKDSLLQNNIILYKGAQLTKPANLNGYVSLRSFLTYAMPLKFIKSNFNVNGGFTWSRIPGIVNYNSSLTNNYTYSTGAVLSSNIREYVDFNLSYNTSFNVANNSAQPLLNNNYRSQTAGLQMNLLSKSGWFVQNDINNQSYSGLSAGFNQNYWLWNVAIGKKFLKKQAGEIKLSVFDLLKQNQSITRTVTASNIEDVQNQVLRQYFLLTFTYKLKNFGTPKAPAQDQRVRRRDGQMGVPPGF